MKYYKQWKEARDKRGRERKLDLIKQKGGCCQTCGYRACTRALVFHHREESEKLFTLDVSNLYKFSIDKIEEEAAKCDLLCQNCHQAHHEYLDTIQNSKNVKRQKYIRLKKEILSIMGEKCSICEFTSELISTLTFHHLRDKSFDINARTLRDLAREKIFSEVSKCVLLCFNCHMEVEAGLHQDIILASPSTMKRGLPDKS